METYNRRLSRLAGLAGLAAASVCHATWSIILVDLRTGEVAAGSATCLTGFDLRANTPVMLTGIGAATAQSAVDSTGQNRVFIRDRLWLGTAPSEIITGLSGFDPSHQSRQYGIVDARGRAATFSGSGASAWAGGQTGQFNYVYAGQSGTVAYAIQGNILTGPCVVDAAVLAAINAPGDLPAKLMAAMQAARMGGGDGRCSCPGNPTGCGCPPASFVKSSHIAYMLIARAGDRDGSTGIYRSGSGPWAMAAKDFDGDGRIDLATANTSASTMTVLRNTTATGSPFATFGLPTTYAGGAAPRELKIVDLTCDGIDDLVAVHFNSGTISVYPGQAGGGFGARVDTATAAGPQTFAIWDFDGVNGPDVAVGHATGNTIGVFLNNGSGGLSQIGTYPAGSDPRGLVAADFNGDSKADLVVCSRNQSKLLFFAGAGGGVFSLPTDIPTPPFPTALIARDVDGDGDIDLVVGTQGSPAKFVVLLNGGSGTFTGTIIDSPTLVFGFDAGDLDRDDRLDLVATHSTGQFTVLRGLGGGAFSVPRTYTVGGSSFDAQIGDYNGDGDPDVALASVGTSSVLIAENLGDGTFSDGIGTATGDYFMNFNVAFTNTPDPDPVSTLQVQFDAWRAGLTGRPDAVQSQAAAVPASVPSTPGTTSTLTMALRDWQGSPITAAVASVTIEHAPGSAGATQIGPVTNLGGGVYSVVLTTTSSLSFGVDRFRVRVDDGVRPVVLMPEPRLTITNACHADCNGDGRLNLADFGCFQSRFALLDPYADCNGDGLLTAADFACFQGEYAKGCP
jgi:hypothetical protein